MSSESAIKDYRRELLLLNPADRGGLFFALSIFTLLWKNVFAVFLTFCTSWLLIWESFVSQQVQGWETDMFNHLWGFMAAFVGKHIHEGINSLICKQQ